MLRHAVFFSRTYPDRQHCRHVVSDHEPRIRQKGVRTRRERGIVSINSRHHQNSHRLITLAQFRDQRGAIQLEGAVTNDQANRVTTLQYSDGSVGGLALRQLRVGELPQQRLRDEKSSIRILVDDEKCVGPKLAALLARRFRGRGSDGDA